METISVKNYRSIIDSGEIKIAPLTVAVGKNSSGKSSFVRLFPLLKQTLERKISDTLLWYGDYVDFGDFQHTVSKNNPEKPIEITFSIKLISTNIWIPRHIRKDFKDGTVVYVTLSIYEKYIEKVKIKIYDQKIEIDIDENGKAKIIINDDTRPFEQNKLLAIRETGNIVPTIEEDKNQNKDEMIFFTRRIDKRRIVKYCENYIYDGKSRKELKSKNIVSPFYEDIDISIDSKENILKKLQKINCEKFGKQKVEHKRFLKINNYIMATKLDTIIDQINNAVSSEMKQTSYLKPIRAMVNRYYRVQGISIDELDADGSNLPMILKNMSDSELRKFETWSKEKFGTVFSVSPGEGHISLVIKDDIDGKVITNVADTGYGYSQMLPIVMLLWIMHSRGYNTLTYNKTKTIVIEQPELHLHPAYQAKMVDVFINIIDEARKNGIIVKIIIETHSEAMINRIGALIGKKRIEAKDVKILIFDKKNGYTKIETKDFDDDGLLMGWPIGFFSTEED